MMSHTKFKKVFLRLKIGPKVTFLPKSLLTFYWCKIEGFKGRPLEKRLFGSLFWEGITFDWQRVTSWYWYGMKVWCDTSFSQHPPKVSGHFTPYDPPFRQKSLRRRGGVIQLSRLFLKCILCLKAVLGRITFTCDMAINFTCVVEFRFLVTC